MDAILAQVLGSSSRLFLLGVAFSSGCSCRRLPEGSRRIRGRKVAGKEMAEQDMEYILHIYHCWTKKMKNLFFFPSLLFLQRSLVQTVLLVSLQANEEHEGQKSRAHAGAYGSGGSRLEGGGSVGASARSWLQLG